MTKRRAVAELFIADIFWGFAFVAVPLAQRTWDSTQICLLRFGIPALLGIILGAHKKAWRLSESELKLGILPGLLLAATIYAQTLGLEYTTPSKSSFLTVLYVILVPLLESYLLQQALPRKFWFAIIGAVVGLALLFDLDWQQWNIGDSITVGCAVFSTWHIHQVGLMGKRFRYSLHFSLAQCIWATLFLLPFSVYSKRTWWPQSWDPHAIFGLVMLTFGATVIAFSLQARVQKHLSLSTSAVIFILESPIAMLFSWLILSEAITLVQFAGAIIIVVACVLAIKATPAT